MRRVLASLAIAGSLVVGTAGVAVAADPVSIDITGASLVARGVAVDVTLDVVCDPVGSDTAPRVEYGYVQIDQAVSKKLIATGRAESLYGNEWTCDSVTVNTVTVTVRASVVPFRRGVALVEAYVYFVDSEWMEYASGRTTAAVTIGR